MKKLLCSLGLMVALSQANQNDAKNVTIVKTTSSADGSVEVSRELLVDCIQSLPKLSELKAQTTARVEFLREINGEKEKNEQLRVWSARIEITYPVYQKEMVVVSQRSVQGKEPLVKDVEKRSHRTHVIEADPSHGDIFAGRSNRRYYFSSAEAASANALEKAGDWLKQQRVALCADK